MADFLYKDPSAALTNVIDDNATLADGVRAAGDYDNSSARQPMAIAKLTVQFDSGPPTQGDIIAELFIIPGDAETSEEFAEGGDAAIGEDDDPQAIFYQGSFETRNPSTTVNEQLMLPIVLWPHGNRFVLKNVSGQTFDATWQLDIIPYNMADA